MLKENLNFHLLKKIYFFKCIYLMYFIKKIFANVLYSMKIIM